MTKLCFKYEQLDKVIIPKINSINDELSILKEETKNLDIPSDFKYYNYLKTLDDSYNEWINNFKSLVDQFVNLHKDLMVDMDDMDNQLDNIEVLIYKQ